MTKILIMAYMGTGKTELENKYENIVDFDFQDYRYVYDESIRHLPLEQRKGSANLRSNNPDYPKNFLEDAIKLLNEGKIVVSPFIDHVFKAYASSEFQSRLDNTRIILVCPERENFNEYIDRFRQRGNSEEFIERRTNEFPDLMDLFESATQYERIVVPKGKFLSQVLEDYGIELKPKTTLLKK